ncbi:MAG: hypothetical protein WC530_03145, partial [Candidatus Omnitrophota bacterium]
MKKWFLLSYCLLLAGCASQAPNVTHVAAPVPTILTSITTPETAKDDTIVKIKIETTKGDIYADLYEAEAPKT